VIDGTNYAVMVDRGWIPFDQINDLSQFNETGTVTVVGVIRNSQPPPIFGGAQPPLAPGQTRRPLINRIDVQFLQGQTSEKLLPVYLHENPDPAHTQLPYRSQTTVELTNGPHLNYAIQWFSFATVLALGFPYLVYRETRKRRAIHGNERVMDKRGA